MIRRESSPIPSIRSTRCAMLVVAVAVMPLVVASADPAHDAATTHADSQTVAVLPLRVDTRDTLLAPLAYGLADLLSTDLSRSKRLTLVERARLAAVLRELSLAASGAVDSTNAPRTGRLLEARTLITGSVTRRQNDDDIVFEARVSDVATGRVTSGFVARAPLSDVLAAEKELAFRLFDHLGIVLTPQERSLVEQRPTNNLAALLAYGQAVQAEVNGQYAAAARAYRRAAAADPGFRQALAAAQHARAEGSNAAGLAVNRVNRPMETVPTTLRPGLATDPALSGSRATITVIINTR